MNGCLLSGLRIQVQDCIFKKKTVLCRCTNIRQEKMIQACSCVRTILIVLPFEIVFYTVFFFRFVLNLFSGIVQ